MKSKILKIVSFVAFSFMLTVIGIGSGNHTVSAITYATSSNITIFSGQSWSYTMKDSNYWIGTVNGNKKGRKYEKDSCTVTLSGKTCTIKAKDVTSYVGQQIFLYSGNKEGKGAHGVRKIDVTIRPGSIPSKTVNFISHSTPSSTLKSSSGKTGDIYMYEGDSCNVRMNTFGTIDSRNWSGSGLSLSSSSSEAITIKTNGVGDYNLSATTKTKYSNNNEHTATEHSMSGYIRVHVIKKPYINVLDNNTVVSQVTVNKNSSKNFAVQKNNISNDVQDSISFVVPTAYSNFISVGSIDSKTGLFPVSTKEAFPFGMTSMFTINWTLKKGDSVISDNGEQLVTKNVYVKLGDMNTIQSISFPRKTIESSVGKKINNVPEFFPSTKIDRRLKWLSSNNDIASVDSNGNVQCKDIGMANISARTMDGSNKVASYKIIVHLPSPKNIKVTTVSQGIKLNWESVQNASKYIVYRSRSENGVFEKIGETTNLVFVDKKVGFKGTYFYKVIAKSYTGETYDSEYSDVIKAKTILSTPKIKSIKKKKGYFKIIIKGKRYSGFVITYGKKKNPKVVKAIIKGKSASIYIPKGYKHKKVYFRVRAYKKIGRKYIYSGFSKNKVIK